MPEKGQWFTLDAIARLSPNEQKKIRLTLLGSPPPYRYNLKEELLNYIEQLQLLCQVEVHDFVGDPNDFIAISDIGLIPSIMPDPFPTTVLESLMHGKPVIVTNHGGAAEIIQTGINGITIPPNDVTSFTNALRFFIENSADYNVLSQNARKTYEDHLTIEQFRLRFLNAFS